MDILSQLEETAEFLKSKYSYHPKVGIVLGSGLSNFTDEIAA